MVKTIAGDKDFTNTITLGKDSKAGLPGGIEYTVSQVCWSLVGWGQEGVTSYHWCLPAGGNRYLSTPWNL